MGILDELLARQNETDQMGGMPMPAQNAPEPQPAPANPPPQNQPPAPRNPNFLRNLLTDFIGTLADELKSGSFQQAVGKGIQAGTARGGTAGQAFGTSFGGLPDIEQQNKQIEIDNQLRQAQIGELIARGKAHGQPQIGKTPEERTLESLMTGNNGNPQINPETKKPYTMLEAFTKIKQVAQEVKPLPAGEHPLGESVSSINQTLTDRWQVLNPGKTLPSQYTLGPDAKQKDYDRVDRQLEQLERAKGTEAQRNTANAIRQQTFEMMKDKKNTEEQAINIAANALASGDLTRLRDIASFRGDQRLLIFARAETLNPNFNTAKVDRQIDMMKLYTTGKQGDQLQSFGTVLEHAGALADTMEQLKNTSASILNKPINWLRAHIAESPEYRRVLAALDPVQKEFESYLLNNRALYLDDREIVDRMINEDMPPSALMAALQQMGHTVQARYNEADRRFKNTMNGKGLEELLGPISDEAKEAGKKIGVTIGSQGGIGGGVQPPSFADWKKNQKP